MTLRGRTFVIPVELRHVTRLCFVVTLSFISLWFTPFESDV